MGLTTLPPSYADCLEIWEPQPHGILRPAQACNGIALPIRHIQEDANLRTHQYENLKSHNVDKFSILHYQMKYE